MRCREVRRFVSFGGLLLVLLASPAYAQTIQSPNYQFDETSIGTGGLLDSQSNNYGILESTGDLGVGESNSANLQVQAGSQTNVDPVLSFSVDEINADFSTLSATEAATATATFSVKNYSSWGYAVSIYGSPPSNGPHAIKPISDTPSLSQIGIEQFGINLVANTSPTSFGANPDNGDFGVGVVEPLYNTSDRFYYASGDIIASGPKSSGETKYTISYLANVTGTTPGGVYQSRQTLVVTGTY